MPTTLSCPASRLTSTRYVENIDHPTWSYSLLILLQLLVRAGLDHDLGLFGLDIHVPDFQKVQIVYPFVDLLGDGYSSFAYEKYLLLTADNLVAIAGVAGYGDIPVPSTFTPNGDAYAYAPGSHSEIIFNAFTVLNPVTPAVTTQFTPQPHLGPWPLEL